MTVRIQPAHEEDAARILAWRNQPAMIARGNGMAVSLSGHAQWWINHAMNAAMCRLWVVRVDDAPVGFIRFDREGASAVVSIYLDEEVRGQGVGREVFRQAWSHRPMWAERAVAEVRLDNPGARRFFRSLGFLPRLPGRLGLARYVYTEPAHAA